MCKVIIVVPIYKEMTLLEQISFLQLQRVLDKYPLCFMAPKRLGSFFRDKSYKVEFFPDASMSNVLEYSKLLLTPEFYERFIKYQFMLLYQLDAFVFSDQLERFCEMGYDYIGAPIPRLFWGEEFKLSGLRSVQNGGFSLRNTANCLQMTLIRKSIYEQTDCQHKFERAEDVFFSYCGNMKDINFRIPNASLASTFSATFNVGYGLRRIEAGLLPFGCHAWSNPNYFHFWRPYIEPFVGKEKMELVAKEVISYRQDGMSWVLRALTPYLIRRIIRYGDQQKAREILGTYMNIDKGVIVWGRGVIGQRCLELFSFLHVPVQCVFDRNVQYEERTFGIPVKSPDISILKERKYTVIIATSKYYLEIANYLSKAAFHPKIDYFSYIDIECSMVQSYYFPIWEHYISLKTV